MSKENVCALQAFRWVYWTQNIQEWQVLQILDCYDWEEFYNKTQSCEFRGIEAWLDEVTDKEYVEAYGDPIGFNETDFKMPEWEAMNAMYYLAKTTIELYEESK